MKNISSLYEATNYVEILKYFILRNKANVGYKSRLSDAAACQLSYLSQVLKGNVHLTPDHGARLCHFWGLSALETEFFLELLASARAGSAELKKYIQSRITRIKNESRALSTQILAEAPQGTHATPAPEYYSQWYTTAIHILVTIPDFQSEEAISRRLSLETRLVRKTLLFLETQGLVEREGSLWKVTQKKIHIPKDSPYHIVNHANWRQRSIDSVSKDQDFISYSALHSISKKDLESLQNMIMEFIKKTRSLIDPSKEEELICFNLDLFSP